ncbi:MAG: dihydropteroate synthase [Nitrospira sp.]|jgi:dihydropteroate synthase|nr:MAG: dihydropteroate synthase [Nitrospira sp.]
MGQPWFSAKGREIHCNRRPLVMGVVNVTTDSFYDGGRYVESERAIAHALELVEQGADIIDLGGESTRPGACSVSEQDELAHVIPVVKGLAHRVSVPISIDTSKSRVAEVALDCGASIINDVSALRQDPAMALVIARFDAAVVLMHMQGTPQTMQQSPQYSDVVGEVVRFLEGRVQIALRAGIAGTNILLDPGFGFGKLVNHNLDLLDGLSVIAALNRPVLVGLSRKAFIGNVVERPVEHREWGTAAAVALAVDRGAHILRVHDVAMMIDVVKMAAALNPRWSSYRQEHDA